MKIPLINPESQGVYPQNFYFVKETEDGRPAMRGTPGLKRWLDLSATMPYGVRALHVMDDKLYSVMGDKFYAITDPQNYTENSVSMTKSSGAVMMADNGSQVMLIQVGVNGYIYKSSDLTLNLITDSDFPTPGSLAMQDYYFFVTQYNADRIWQSTLLDGTSWPNDGYGEAEIRPDRAVRAISAGGELWVLNELTYEVFRNIGGTSNFSFQTIPGAFHETGCSAADSAATEHESLFWFDDNRMVRMSQGYSSKIVSPDELNRLFAGYGTVSDAKGFTYVDRGSSFYVLTFPTENITWAYNIASGTESPIWHQWASFPSDGRHRSNCYAYFDGKMLVGDHQQGIIYELDPDTYDDDDHEIRSVLTLPSVITGGKEIPHNRLQVDMKTGVGLTNDHSVLNVGSNPVVGMEYSDDRKNTWANLRSREIGKRGKYKTRVFWTRLGRSENRAYRFTITDPVEREIYGINLNEQQ